MSEDSKQGPAIALFSRGIRRIPHIGSFLDLPVVLNPSARDRSIVAAAGWGRKPSGERAARYADLRGLPCLRLEDGFLRSVDLGVRGQPPLSIVVDDLGIYFDATRPSRLEAWLADDDFPPELLSQGEQVLESILLSNLSKYNHAPDASRGLLGESGRERVLLIDQTGNDQSIRYGLASEQSFRELLDAARAENPGAQLYIKTHPDVIAGRRTSAFAFARSERDLRWIADDVSPLSLLRLVDRVYTVSSQMGFEALLLGKPVTCFGMPFYAGWGVTDDRVGCPRRVRRRSVLEIFAAAYLRYPRYIDPVSGERAGIERVVEHLALQRRCCDGNRGKLFCFGFSFWKRAYVKPFLSCPGNRVHFVRTADQARKRGFDEASRILVWGVRESKQTAELADRFNVPIWRMEDGFIRSIGLGSDFARPWSLVIDRSGIYFDAGAESDLERLLNEADFPAELIARARRVREIVSAYRITKYNIESDAPLRLAVEQGVRKILVPGQVEDDASIQKGAGAIRTNEALLRAVRAAHPDAFIVYKPHPDLMARNRGGQTNLASLGRWCDHVESRHSIIGCIEAVDEVHTITSLSGFDALLRAKRVVTYGAPFYAGWGLTDDGLSIARRWRTRDLDELVAAALLLYPRYWDADAGCFVELESILQKIIAIRSAAGLEPEGRPFPEYLRRKLRKWLTWTGAVVRSAVA